MSAEPKRWEAIRQFLRGENTVVLSTVSPAGQAQSAPLFYLLQEDPLELYWLSSPSSEHSANIEVHTSCSAAVFRSTDKWEEIVGVQMRGLVDLVKGPKRKSIVKRYCDRYELGFLPSIAISRCSLYVFRPNWIRFLDNSKGFGYKYEIVIEGSAPVPKK